MRASLDGKHVLITGATRGIGRSLAVRLARERACLSLCGRNSDALEAVAQEARAARASGVFTRRFDLRSATDIADFASAAADAHGPVEILVNNAGFNSRKAPVEEVGLEEFDDIVAVNLRAPFILLRSVLPDMIARRSGHIVNVLSTVCHFDNETMSAYTAAKKGLQGLHGVLLKEARQHDVRVSAVYPGGTDTTFRAKPRPDYMHPDSVAEAIYSVLALPSDVVVHDITFRPMIETNF